MYKYGLTFLVFCLCSCGTKVKFDEHDLSWIPYETGDTLVFKSLSSKYDTIVITEKKIFYSGFNPIERDDKYQPQFAHVRALVFSKSKEKDYRLFYMEKRYPDKPANISIRLFKNSYISRLEFAKFVKKSDSPNFLSNKGSEFYKIYKDILPGIEEGPSDTLYWELGEGLIGYETAAGEKWVLVEKGSVSE